MAKIERAPNYDCQQNFLVQQIFDGSAVKKFSDGSPSILGIDEAGRGPVLGPMVYACAVTYCDGGEDLLKSLGVNDSKKLSEGERTDVFRKIFENEAEFGDKNLVPASFMLQIIHPKYISISMNRRLKYSLNDISHNSAVALIQRALDHNINVKKVFVDTVGPKITYSEFLKHRFPNIPEIIVSEKADSIYPVVGAASIAAKVTRDDKLKNWIFEEECLGIDYSLGSGYPGDPTTKKFLNKSIDHIFGYPSVVRFSWKTAEILLEKRALTCSWESNTTTASLKDFWKPAGTITRSPFLKDRFLTNVTDPNIF